MDWSWVPRVRPPAPLATPVGSRPALVPRLGPLPPGWPTIPLVALLLAWGLGLPASARPGTLLLGGPPDIPGLAHTASQMASRGPWAWAHSRMMMYPSVHDLYGEMSFPGDGIVAAPFIRVLGWPAGFTVFTVATLAFAGTTAGLLAARWWRSLPAGLLAVAALETSGVVLREISEGRLTHALGLGLAPLAVGWFARGLVEDRGRWSFAAGVAVGLSALVFWYQVVWVGLLLLALAMAGAVERLRVLRHTAWGALGAWWVAGFPLLYTVAHAGEHPGSQVGPWDLVEEIPGEPMPLLTLLESRDVGGMGLMTGAWAARPLLFLGCALGLVAGPPRRVVVPLLWIAVAWGLAEGPVWTLPGSPIFSPILLQSHVPLMRRYWWPDRYLLVASLGVALLVAGAGAALLRRFGSPARRAAGALALGAALVAEAALTLPTLPLAATEAPAAERLAVLRTGTGPLLVLPLRDLDPDARNRVWASDVLLEQIHHRRPLLAGPMNPEAVVAGDLYRDFWSGGVLREIRSCENAWKAPPERSAGWEAEVRRTLHRLHRAGLREIVADPAREGPDRVAVPWRACLVEVLGPPTGEAGPLRVYAVPAP